MDIEQPRREARTTSPYAATEFASCYERLAEPHHFAAPARDLVAALELFSGAVVLDVGSGTGAVAARVTKRVAPRGIVVAMDPALAMLRRQPRDSRRFRVVGEAPGLPFAGGSFDAVLAGFALSHLESYAAGLADMVRVLRPGGSVGVTAWGPGQSEAARVWREVGASFLALEELERAFRKLIPWDEWLADPANVGQALAAAGLERVEVREPRYCVAMSVEDFLALRDQSVEGILLLELLGPDRWSEFQQRASEAFQRRFPAGVEYVRAVNLGLGRKPR